MSQLQYIGAYRLLFFALQLTVKYSYQNLKGSGTDRRSQQMTTVCPELAVRPYPVDMERRLTILPGDASRKTSHFQILQFLFFESFFLGIEKTELGMQKSKTAELRGRNLLADGKFFQRREYIITLAKHH